VQPTVSLTPDQISFYRQNGFLAIDAITSQDEVAWMRGIYDDLFARRVGREEGNQFDLAGTDEEGKEAALPQILGPSDYAPELKAAQCQVNALHIARQLLGAEADGGGDHAILKPALIGAETPWHQDEAYWDPATAYNSISIWIPLQEATLENGCMWFVPGSHMFEVQPHHPINNDPRIHGLEIDEADVSTAVACPIPAGGATIHHCRTLHYTGPNRSDQPRRAYIVGYGLPGKPLAAARDFYWQRQRQTPREERAKAARSAGT
jgi:ectoine hydroxylase-related dioxygenase (phytanoyl-CoA dioxygenase family)